MPEPLTVLAGAGALAGGLGSLFGSGQETLLPGEFQDLLNITRRRSTFGIDNDTESALRTAGRGQIENEFEALTSSLSRSLRRTGLAPGSVSRGQRELLSRRMQALDALEGRIAELDERARASAISTLPAFAAQIAGYTRDTGGGSGALFGESLKLLFNQFSKKGGK